MTVQEDLPRMMREAADRIPVDSDRIVEGAVRRGRRRRRRASAVRAGVAACATVAVVAVGSVLLPSLADQGGGANPGGGTSFTAAPPTAAGPLGAVEPADPATVTVAVRNATSAPQLARQTATALKAAGFSIDSIGNVDVCAALDSCDDLTPTTIDYAPGQEAAARAVLDRYPGARPRLAPGTAVVTLTLGVTGAAPRR